MTEISEISQLIGELERQGLLHPSPWLDVPQAASYCHLSSSHLNNLRSRGEGPRWVKQSGRILYHRQWLDSWLLDGAGERPEELENA